MAATTPAAVPNPTVSTAATSVPAAEPASTNGAFLALFANAVALTEASQPAVEASGSTQADNSAQIDTDSTEVAASAITLQAAIAFPFVQQVPTVPTELTPGGTEPTLTAAAWSMETRPPTIGATSSTPLPFPAAAQAASPLANPPEGPPGTVVQAANRPQVVDNAQLVDAPVTKPGELKAQTESVVSKANTSIQPASISAVSDRAFVLPVTANAVADNRQPVAAERSVVALEVDSPAAIRRESAASGELDERNTGVRYVPPAAEPEVPQASALTVDHADQVTSDSFQADVRHTALTNALDGLRPQVPEPVTVTADVQPSRADTNGVDADPMVSAQTKSRVPVPHDGAQTSFTAVVQTTAVSQDNQLIADRNVATERSTTMSLGPALARESTVNTAGEAAHNGEGAESEGERQPARSSAEQDSIPSPATSGTAPAPVEPPRKADLPINAAESTQGPSTAASSPEPQAHERVRVVEQITRKIETMRLVTGRKEVTIHLRPEHLGDLRLTVITESRDVVARISADTALARDAVHDGRDQLRAALESKGYTLQGLDVSLGSGTQQQFANFQHERSTPRATPMTPRAPLSAVTAAVEETTRRGPTALSTARLDTHA